jgi:hypothetical protein
MSLSKRDVAAREAAHCHEVAEDGNRLCCPPCTLPRAAKKAAHGQVSDRPLRHLQLLILINARRSFRCTGCAPCFNRE